MQARHNGLGLLDGLVVHGNGLGANVQPQEALGHTGVHVTILDLAILTELGGADKVHRQDELHTLLLGLLLDFRHQLGTLLIVEGGTNLNTGLLDESESHATANDHDVHLKRVLDRIKANSER